MDYLVIRFNYYRIFVSQNFIIVVLVMTVIFIYPIFIITITCVLIIKGSSAINDFEVSKKKIITNFAIIINH